MSAILVLLFFSTVATYILNKTIYFLEKNTTSQEPTVHIFSYVCVTNNKKNTTSLAITSTFIFFKWQANTVTLFFKSNILAMS